MKNKLIIGLSVIIIVIFAELFLGHKINKQNSASKKKEIFNLTQQLQSKNNQISIIQKFFLRRNENINDIVSPNYINFSKIFINKNLGDLKNYSIK